MQRFQHAFHPISQVGHSLYPVPDIRRLYTPPPLTTPRSCTLIFSFKIPSYKLFGAPKRKTVIGKDYYLLKEYPKECCRFNTESTSERSRTCCPNTGLSILNTSTPSEHPHKKIFNARRKLLGQL